MSTEKPIDIRQMDQDEYWGNFRRKWNSLLTYRYIGRRWASLDSGVEGENIRLRHDMRNSAGGITVAPLCIMSPECGGFNDDTVVPNPLIASMQILDPANDVAEVMVIPDVLHTGRRLGFSRALVVDAANPSRVIAVSTGVGLSLGPQPEGYVKEDNDPIEVTDSPDMPRLTEVFGVSHIDRGVWQIGQLTSEIASPDAALHLGPQHIALEAAASDLAENAAGSPVQIEDWYVMFVNRGKTGPFRTHGEAFIGAGGVIGVRVDLIDDGEGARVVSTCAARFRVAG